MQSVFPWIDILQISRSLLLGIFLFIIVLFFFQSVFSQSDISIADDTKTVVVDEAVEMEIFVVGKNVIVKKSAKGVLAFGGDIIIEGSVDGDVATIGGSVIQRENGYIGGDIIIFGGTYKHDSAEPKRAPGHETIMYAGYEEELRELSQNPTQIFSPSFSVSFFVQRLLSVLFWFVVAYLLAMIAPGAVGRAVSNMQLAPLRVAGIGMIALLLATLSILLGLKFLPGMVGALYSVMALILLLLAYVFGRASIVVYFGKLIQRRIFAGRSSSDTVAILLGSIVLVVILSLPYLWTFAVVMLFAASLGLVATTRQSGKLKVAG